MGSRIRWCAALLCLLSTLQGHAQLHHFKVEAAAGGAIPRQRAGVAFAIKITAQQANNTTYTAFTGKVRITSTGSLTAGGDSTAKFVAGVLSSHSVTIGNTGQFTITATKDSSGTSAVFPVTAFRSDDFNAYNLNTAFWTFTDPIGDATLQLSGTKTPNARLALSVPAGVPHDLYAGRNTAPRVMQPAANSDFTLDVKFDSPVSQAYQLQGVIIQQSPTVLLRFDLSSDGIATMAYAGSTADGFTTEPVTQIPLTAIAGNGIAPLYLRIQRSGNTWTMQYSINGTTYLSAGSFSYALTVTQAGLFAANGGATIPAHTALVDYFFDAAQPITPEDGGTVVDSLPPLVYGLTSIAGGTDIRITWKTDERAKTRFEYGKTTSYGTTVLDDTLRTAHTITLRNLSSNTLYNFRVIAYDSLNRRDTTANIKDTTYARTPTTITPWYGTTQMFGKVGTPQRYVNILGNVADPAGIDSAWYKVNNGPLIPFSVGPDTRRLYRTGDFNLDIPYASLVAGTNTVAISTKNIFGEAASSTITVRDSSAAVWPLPYSVTMSATKSLTDSVQVTDGRWAINGGFAQIVERGYDRVIAVGDTTWTDYEITTRLKIKGIDSSLVAYASPSNGPAIAYLMRWSGHTNDPITGKQPLEGYLPLGAFAACSWTSVTSQKWEMFGNGLVLKDTKPAPTLAFDTLYNFKLQVTTFPGQGGYYRFRVWKASQTEPTTWLMSMQEPLDAPQNGSVLIVAHHSTAWIDQITVTRVPPDGTPPVLSGTATDTYATAAYVTLTTDEPARVRIKYGTTAGYGKEVLLDSVLRTSHGIPIVGLTPSTTYHYAIVATDNAGNAVQSSDGTFVTGAPASPATLTADDFTATSLNGRWTFVNPAGDATIATPGGSVSIGIPAGAAHDIWTTGYGVPRILQGTNNTDFITEVKWVSPLVGSPTAFQTQGIVVQQDAQNLIRFDLTSNADGVHAFSAVFRNGFQFDSIQIHSYALVPDGAGTQPLWLRVIREGDIWSSWYSTTGSTWTLATRFHHDLVVSAVGLFAGNAGTAPPAFTSVVDYFHTTLPTEAVDDAPAIPTVFAMDQNYPNPFNPAAVIRYHVADPRMVQIVVYDLLGRKVAVLVNEKREPGSYNVTFDGSRCASGMYIVRMMAGPFVETRKMLLVR